jgi:hypothetical protein
MRRLIAAALLAAVAAAAAEAAPPRRASKKTRAAPAIDTAAAAAILDQIQRRGPRPVLDELYAREARWRTVVQGVASGDPTWLAVASKLKPVATRQVPIVQDLTSAVARALERAPANVLAILNQAFDTDNVCSLNTLEDSLGHDYQTALRTVERREKAVAAVNDPALGERKEECLDFLAELKREVVRNRDEWFVSR